MVGENDDSDVNKDPVDSGFIGAQNPESMYENDGENNDQFSEIEATNGEEETSQDPKEPDTLSNRRLAISKTYLDAPGLVETKFVAHKKSIIPTNDDKGGGFDIYFAATLPLDEKDDVLLIESGDYFSDFIFMICIQAVKDTDLQFVFIKKSWLEKCPAESEGLDAMKIAEGTLFAYLYYQISQ